MSVMNGSAVALANVRTLAAAALAPLAPEDPDVHLDVVDALHPPALMLIYDDPWLTPITMGCLYECRLEVLCIASRVEPGPAFTKLEELVAYTLERMAADSHSWPAENASAPRVHTIAGVPYLGARIVYRVRVSL